MRSGYSAPKLAALRDETLKKYDILSSYLSAFEEAGGMQNFLNAYQNYPALKGMQTNLYKCFLPMAWRIGSERGVSTFLHPEGIYDDPKGGRFREEVYRRLRYHFQFVNVKKLFSEILHWVTYSVNVYGKAIEPPSFHIMANVFHPQTIDESFGHRGYGIVDGIKNEKDEWNIKGHRERLIKVGMQDLSLFAKLYDDKGTPALQARLPNAHSKQIVEVLRKFAAHPRRLGDIKDDYHAPRMWDETNAQIEGTIRRETRFPDSPNELIFSGPHFYVQRSGNR